MRGLVNDIACARPTNVAELTTILAAAPKAMLIAGGTDVMVRLEAGAPLPPRFIDLSGLGRELRHITVTPAAVELGALTTFWDVRTWRDAAGRPALREEFPLLEEAARTVGAAQIQNRGTWAGNVANGSPAADGWAALLAYDAVVVLQSAAGRREAPLHGFYTGYKQMDLRPGEFIAALRLPRRGPDLSHHFHKVGTRRAQAITKVGLILTCRANETHRVVGTSLAPYVTRYELLETLLDGAHGKPDERALRAVIAEEVKPIDDIRSTAAYRLEAFTRLLLSLTR